jgi:hypothetical protein
MRIHAVLNALRRVFTRAWGWIIGERRLLVGVVDCCRVNVCGPLRAVANGGKWVSRCQKSEERGGMKW